MRVTILQPTYWARAHVWNRIMSSDVYVWLDSVQFARSKTKWEDRTIIEGRDGRAVALRLPVAGRRHLAWSATGLNDGWQKHALSIRHCYARRPHWPVVAALLPMVYGERASTIERVCWRSFQAVAAVLRPRCAVVRSSELGIASRRGDLMHDLVAAVGGTSYLTGRPGAEYLPVDRFAESEIAIEVQDWAAPATAGGLCNPSILHLLAVHGVQATASLLATPPVPAVASSDAEDMTEVGWPAS